MKKNWLIVADLIFQLMYMIPDNIVMLINDVSLWLQVSISYVTAVL